MGWIEAVNERLVPIDLFKELVGTLADLPVEERSDFESRALGMVKRLEKGQTVGDYPLIIMSVQLRMEALAKLSREPEYRAWTLGSHNGGDFIHEKLIETAATQPLIGQDDDSLAFEPRSFFLAALARTASGGRA